MVCPQAAGQVADLSGVLSIGTYSSPQEIPKPVAGMPPGVRGIEIVSAHHDVDVDDLRHWPARLCQLSRHGITSAGQHCPMTIASCVISSTRAPGHPACVEMFRTLMETVVHV